MTEINKKYLATSCIVGFAASLLLALLYSLARVGVSDIDLVTTLKSLSLSGFLIFSPYVIAGSTKFNYFGLSFYSVIACAIAGFIVPSFPWITSLISLFFGVVTVLGLIRTFQDIQPSALRRSEVIFLTSLLVLFACAIANFVWANGYLSPLFLEKFKLGEFNDLVRYANPDTVFHTSIMQMIKNYHVPSTGLNGVPQVQYHIGFHAIMASYSRLLQIRPILFYQEGYPIIFSTLFLRAILDVSIALTSNFKKTFSVIGALFVITLVDMVPNFSHKIWSMNDIFSEESFTLALTFALLLVGVVSTERELWTRKFKLSWATTSLLFFGAIAVSKVAVGFVVISSAMYLLIRLGYLRYWRWRFFFLASTLVSLFIYLECTPRFKSHFLFFALHRLIGAPSHALGFYLFHFMAIYIYFACRLKDEWKLGARKIWKDTKNRQYIDLEILASCLLISLVPAELIDTQGNWAYFTEVPTWICLPFLIAVAGHLLFPLRGSTAKILMVISVFTMGYWSLNFIKSNLIDRLHLRQATYLPNAKLLETLLDLDDSIPEQQKRSTLLYIPKSNRVFWDSIPLCKGFFWPPTVQFLGPALSGIALLDGLPENLCTPYFYGFPSYEGNFTFGKRNASDQEICQATRNLGFGTVVKILELPNKELNKETMSCRPN